MDDIKRERNRFYNCFNSILRKFNNTDFNVFLTLFKSYCIQFYGSTLWFNNFNCKTVLNQFAIGFHKALKKILGVGWGVSNHYVCSIFGLVTFENLININQVKFAHKLINCPPPFISKNIIYFRFYSELLKHTDFIMTKTYDVVDFLNNDIDALISRIYYVHDLYFLNDTFD